MGKTRTFEAEIRDTQAHTSDAMADDADVTVVTDTLHPNSEHEITALRLYIEDDHDEAFDVTLQHTRPGDSGFAHTHDAVTISLASGGDEAQTRLDGPFGRLRLHYATGALASAPTTGSTLAVLFMD